MTVPAHNLCYAGRERTNSTFHIHNGVHGRKDLVPDPVANGTHMAADTGEAICDKGML